MASGGWRIIGATTAIRRSLGTGPRSSDRNWVVTPVWFVERRFGKPGQLGNRCRRRHHHRLLLARLRSGVCPEWSHTNRSQRNQPGTHSEPFRRNWKPPATGNRTGVFTKRRNSPLFAQQRRLNLPSRRINRFRSRAGAADTHRVFDIHPK